MTEPRPREIQLTAKQLVFIFMSTLLVAVVVFLLGVWVGRGIGVEQSASASQTDGVGTTVDLGKLKDTSKSADGASAKSGGDKYDYPKALQGSGSAGGAAQPPPPAPNPAPPAKADPPPADKAQPIQTTPPGKPPATGDSWYVQVGAFTSRANAESMASDLKAKGYNTLVLPGSPFKVRVGPFPQKTAAEQAATRLRKEPGVKNPSVIASR
jgi:cell division septation protein DedD